jgi:hypothetical protein
MNVDELDETIRRGLRAATDDVDGIDPAALARRLEERRARAGSTAAVEEVRDRRPRRALAVAAALVLVAGAALGGFLLTGDREGRFAATDPGAPEPRGFEGWAQGWHQLDTGPVPAMNSHFLVRWGDRLVVIGSWYVEGDDEVRSAAYALDPVTRSWAELPLPPFVELGVVAAGDRLVAVGRGADGPPHRWATLSEGASGWVDHGTVPAAPEILSTGVQPTDFSGRPHLVWTGERVLDMTNGAVLDPATGTARPLPMPADAMDYPHLLAGSSALVGDQVVFVAWSTLPGLAWDRLGTSVTEVPGVPAQWVDPGVAVSASAPAVVDGRITLLASTERGARAGAFDPETQRWERLPDPPGPVDTHCVLRGATVDGIVVSQGCAESTGYRYRSTYALRDGRWVELPAPPLPEDCCAGSLLGGADALVLWDTDADTDNNAAAPYVRGAVWIP